MHKDQLKPKSLSISLAGDEHVATIRFEVDGDIFRIVHIEDGSVVSSREERLLVVCMDYATACIDSGMMLLAPSDMRDALIGGYLDGFHARAAGPTN